MTGESASAGFSPRAILVLVLVGVAACAGLAVLSVYASDLRGGIDGRAHALSSSAIGFRGTTIMLKAMDVPVVISRALPDRYSGDEAAEQPIPLLVLTPAASTEPDDLKAFPSGAPKLIVLPKWATAPEPQHPGFVRKVGLDKPAIKQVAVLLSAYAKSTIIEHRAGVSRPALRDGGPPYGRGTYLPLAQIDRFQTIRGEGWDPALIDETGRILLARSKRSPEVFVLADPDLLNNQGLARRDNARAGMAILQTLRGDSVMFDVTLNGFVRDRSLGRLMLEPPWLAATLCGVAAALLMGLQALVRFGPPPLGGRAIALGPAALIDNSAGLVRMARKEAALAPQYLELCKAAVARGVGRDGKDGAAEAWITELARRRGLASPAELSAQAAAATTRADLLRLGRELHRWRREMIGDGR